MTVTAQVVITLGVEEARLLKEIIQSVAREDHPLRPLADMIEKEIDPCE